MESNKAIYENDKMFDPWQKLPIDLFMHSFDQCLNDIEDFLLDIDFCVF